LPAVSLERHDESPSVGDNPLLHAHEFGLGAQQLLLMLLAAELLRDRPGHDRRYFDRRRA
jgi:hypothetical protein